MGTQPSLAPELEHVDGIHVRYRGRTLVYFGGCDYYRLSRHPVVLAAVASALRRHGLNLAASRVTTGNHRLYRDLELGLAECLGWEGALLTATGYTSDLVAAQALAGRYTHVLIDEGSHASLQDAAALTGRPVIRFPHLSTPDLERRLGALGPRARPLVMTDGLFARDGTTPPLREWRKLLPRSGGLLVDDAHGVGIMGAEGRGTVSAQGVEARGLVLAITLSKAFGVYGGAVLGSKEFLRAAVGASRLFAGHTPLPLPLAAGALAAVRVWQTEPERRARLRNNVERVKPRLRQAGLAVPDNEAPIVAVVPPNPTAAGRLTRRLLASGLYPTLIRYPGGPEGGQFRFALSSEHTPDQLERLTEAVSAWLKRGC